MSTPTGSTATILRRRTGDWPSVEAIAVCRCPRTRSSRGRSSSARMPPRDRDAGDALTAPASSVRRPALARPASGRTVRGATLFTRFDVGGSRLHPSAFNRSTGAQFQLPVDGWRGQSAEPPDARRRCGCRARVIAVRCCLSGRFTAITGETGAGKTMVVTVLGCCSASARLAPCAPAQGRHRSPASGSCHPQRHRDIVAMPAVTSNRQGDGLAELYVSRT